MAYYYSPFECTFTGETQRRRVLLLRVLAGWFPTTRFYSPAFIDLIQAMLADPQKRPTVHRCLTKVGQLLQ